MNNLKIFQHNMKKSLKKIAFNQKIDILGKTKYLPAFSKEWKNTVYSFEKNTLKDIPHNNIVIDKLIKSYFDLYFKRRKFIKFKKNIKRKNRRRILRRIHVSNAEIKYTNNKAIVTLFVINRERKSLNAQYKAINKRLTKFILSRLLRSYRKTIFYYFYRWSLICKQHVLTLQNTKEYLNYKLNFIEQFTNYKFFLTQRIANKIKTRYLILHSKYLRKFHILHSLNSLKFNQFFLLANLNDTLTKLIGKNIQYNIINLKSFLFHPDIFTKVLTYKIKRKKIRYLRNMSRIVKKAKFPLTNTIQERHPERNIDLTLNQYKDLRFISNLSNINYLDNLLSNFYSRKNKVQKDQNVSSNIFESIHYKNLSGIRIEAKGRLTRRYRADRARYSVRLKGGLRNIDSSYKKLTSVLFRGNTQSNMSYSLATSKRRVGAFAIKGWIAGK